MHGGCNYFDVHYTVLYGNTMSLVVSLWLVARRWVVNSCTTLFGDWVITLLVLKPVSTLIGMVSYPYLLTARSNSSMACPETSLISWIRMMS